MNPAVVWLGMGAVGMYGYATGRISDFVDNLSKNRRNDSSKSATAQTFSEPPRPTIIVQPSNPKTNSYLLPLGVAGFIGLGGYYYLIHNNGTKKVIGKVEETAEETQDLVVQSDENNAKRFEVLDAKNEQRAQNLELEIRSETKAGFTVLSEQIECLTQVAIQTLSAIAVGNSNQDQSEQDMSNELLLGYCDTAQQTAETILSDQHLLKTKENNLKDIKAEIQLRNNVILSGTHKTPGGPHDYDGGNPFDIKRRQSAKVTNVSAESYKDHDNERNGASHAGPNMLSSVLNKVEALKVAQYAWDNREYVAVSSGVVAAFYVANKTMDYLSVSSSTGSRNTYSEISGRN